MEFSYGQGTYIEEDKRFDGRIILSEHKLFLQDKEGDLAQTYIPLEKIERLRKVREGLRVHVRPTLYFRYTALIEGEKKYLNELVKDIVKKRGLKKRFLKNEWVESDT